MNIYAPGLNYTQPSSVFETLKGPGSGPWWDAWVGGVQVPTQPDQAQGSEEGVEVGHAGIQATI